jgi:hypothetical protein
MMRAVPRSNCGEEELVIELGEPIEYRAELVWAATIEIRAVLWDSFFDEHYPITSSIAGFWLQAAELTRLVEHIRAWVERPLAELIADGLDGEFELARLPGQGLQLRFGARENTISGLNPVISISYRAGRLHGQFHFVTDQSCLGYFWQNLAHAMTQTH